MKDGVAWRIGIQDEVAWIGDSTPGDTTITAAIPPVFADYATHRTLGRRARQVAVDQDATPPGHGPR